MHIIGKILSVVFLLCTKERPVTLRRQSYDFMVNTPRHVGERSAVKEDELLVTRHHCKASSQLLSIAGVHFALQGRDLTNLG